MSTQAVTPETTKTLDELRAEAVAASTPTTPTEAIPATPAPTEAVAVAPPDKPFTIADADGKVVITLKSGQKYEAATKDEALEKLAEAQFHASETIHKLKVPAAPEVKQELVEKATAAGLSQTQAEEFAAQFLNTLATKPEEAIWEALGRKVGLPADVLVDRMTRLAEFSKQVQDANMAHQFHQSCPDFPADEDSSQKLYKYMADAGMIEIDAQGNVLGETVEKLKAGHAACVKYGVYKPIAPKADDVKVTPPIPMLPGNAAGVSTTATFNPYDANVTTEQVRQWAIDSQKARS